MAAYVVLEETLDQERQARQKTEAEAAALAERARQREAAEAVAREGCLRLVLLTRPVFGCVNISRRKGSVIG